MNLKRFDAIVRSQLVCPGNLDINSKELTAISKVIVGKSSAEAGYLYDQLGGSSRLENASAPVHHRLKAGANDWSLEVNNSTNKFSIIDNAGGERLSIDGLGVINIPLDLVITGDLTVNGTQTILNVETLQVEDKNIEINKGGTTAGTLGAGLNILGDADAVVGFFRVKPADSSGLEVKAPSGSTLSLYATADKTLTLTGDLTVEADSIINQDLSNDANVGFNAVNITVLTANRALVSDGGKDVTSSAVTSTELSQLATMDATTISSNQWGWLGSAATAFIPNTLTVSAGTDLTGGGDLTTNRTISHAQGNGFRHIPADGVTTQILGWSSAGTVQWVDPNTALDADTVDGFHATQSVLADNIVVRDASSYISAPRVGVGLTSPSKNLHLFDATTASVGLRWQNLDGVFDINTDDNQLVVVNNNSINIMLLKSNLCMFYTGVALSTGAILTPDVTAGGLHLEVPGTSGDALVVKDGVVEKFAVSNVGGMRLNQGTDLTPMVIMENDLVAHGMTGSQTTNTFGKLKMHSDQYGGIQVEGYSEQATGARLMGVCTNPSLVGGVVVISGFKKAGTGFTDLAAADIILSIEGGPASGTKFKGNGDLDMAGDLYAGGGTSRNGGSVLNSKEFTVASWNMDTVASINVAHGLAGEWLKIKSIAVVIIANGSASLRHLDTDTGAVSPADGFFFANATNIVLSRTLNGIFDSPSYNAAKVEIVVEYTD